MSRENNQRIAVSKRMIKEGMVRLLKDKELDKISISELCAESGVNRSTFYRYYYTTRDIVKEIEMDMFHKMMEKLRPFRSSNDILGRIEDICNYLYQNVELIKLIYQSDLDASIFGQTIEKDLIFQEYCKIMNINLSDDECSRMVVTYLSGGGYFLLRQWMMGEFNLTPKEMASFIYQLISNGQSMIEHTVFASELNKITDIT